MVGVSLHRTTVAKPNVVSQYTRPRLQSKPVVDIPAPRNLTPSENRTFFRLQWTALSANVANLFLQGYLFAETLHWMPAFFAINQALITIFGGASFWNSYRASQYRKPSVGLSIKTETGQEPSVALCLTAVNEPGEIVEKSLMALHAVDYGPKDIFLLDDSAPGSISSTAYQQLVNNLARKGIQVTHLHRKDDAFAYKGGYKAGNINYFLTRYGKSYKYFATFDADFKLAATFLKATIPVMESPENSRVAILQTAQQFEYQRDNPVSSSAYVGNAAMGDIHGNAKSAPFRPPVPIDSGHPFRSIPATCSVLIPAAF